MNQKTLIALYGEKQEDLSSYLAEIGDRIAHSLPGGITLPYKMEQVHATIIGLEDLRRGSRIYNRNIWEQEGRELTMDMDRLRDVVDRYFPMRIRFGGFSPADTPILSRGEVPYQRSFHIDIPNNRIILMGWPHQKGDFSEQKLLALREALRLECGIAHKYPGDNDFYMVISRLKEGNKEDPYHNLIRLQAEIKEFISGHSLDIEVRRKDLCIAHYTDVRLPTDSTEMEQL